MSDIETFNFATLSLDLEPTQDIQGSLASQNDGLDTLSSNSSDNQIDSPPASTSTSSPPPTLPPSISSEQVAHLAFHPDYKVRFDGDDVIIRFTTKTCFYASLPMLVKHSDFFAHMVELPDTHARSTIIDLPSATSEAIACFISLISPHHPSDWITTLALESNKDALYRLLGGFFTFIDAYEAVGLLSKLVVHFDHKHELHSLIACAGGVEQAAIALSRGLIKGGNLDKHVERLLTQFAPEYGRRWTELVKGRASAWSRCEDLIVKDQKLDGIGNQFGKKCMRGGGCHGSELGQKSFKRFRAHVAPFIVDAIKDEPDLQSGFAACRQAIQRRVRCETCANRLFALFSIAIRKSEFFVYNAI